MGKHHYRSDYWDLVGLDAMGKCQERGLSTVTEKVMNWTP